MMKAITLLGSTGSIGTQTLDIVKHHPQEFRLVGLAAGRNVEMLAAQIREFRPEIVAIADENLLPELRPLPMWTPNPSSWLVPKGCALSPPTVTPKP